MAAEDCGNLTTPKWLNCLRTERPAPLRSQYFSEEAARRRSLVAGELFGRPLPNHPPAADAPLGAEIDDVIGRLDHVEIVLDDDDRVALVDQLLEHVEQLPGVLEVQPGGRLVEDVERAAGAALRQLLRELHPLRLAAREGRRRL